MANKLGTIVQNFQMTSATLILSTYRMITIYWLVFMLFIYLYSQFGVGISRCTLLSLDVVVHNSVNVHLVKRLGADFIEAVLPASTAVRPIGSDGHDQLALAAIPAE